MVWETYKLKFNLILFSLTIIFTSCTTNTTSSFINLEKAFIDWVNYNHPTYLIEYKNINNTFKNNDQASIEDYLLDLNRFNIELYQINKNKLSISNQIKLIILTKKLIN